MNTSKYLFYLFCAFLFLQGFAQQPTNNVLKYDLSSKATGQEYELFVSLPHGYAAKDTTRYPVLYVLDGNFMFPVMRSFQRLLSELQEVKEVIVVGVGYPTNSILASTEYRTPDYTPTRDTTFERSLTEELKMNVRTGGADKFLQALKTEIFPFIESRYRTGERGLAGHSFGGLFGAYVLLQEPGLFSKYLLSSISLFWDKDVILKKEQAFYQAGNRNLPAHVFVTVGAQEQFMGMIPSMQKMVTSMRAHNYKGLVIEERILPNETHASAFLTAFNQGIRVLYKK
jgi:uncharacterized protein